MADHPQRPCVRRAPGGAFRLVLNRYSMFVVQSNLSTSWPAAGQPLECPEEKQCVYSAERQLKRGRKGQLRS